MAGDTYARCQASVSGLVEDCYPSGNSAPCTYPDKLGVVRTGYTYADPNYAPPVVVGGAQAKPGSAVIIAPGTFAADPAAIATMVQNEIALGAGGDPKTSTVAGSEKTSGKSGK